MSSTHRCPSAFMAVLEFEKHPAFPVPADSLDEAANLAERAACELPGLVRVALYGWCGAGGYVLVQTLEVGDPSEQAA